MDEKLEIDLKKNIKPSNALYADNYYNFGIDNLSKGNYEEAILSFIKCGNFYKNNLDFYCHLGNAYMFRDMYLEAKDTYLKALKIMPENPNIHFNLGIAYSNLNDQISSINSFKKCIKYDPKYSNAYKFLGNLLKDIKDFSGALKIYREWEKIDPSNPEPLVNQSFVHLRNGQFNLGWKMYEAGLKNNIRDPLNGFDEETKILWDGKPFDGTLLVYGEQGLGDQIIFGTVIAELLETHSNVFLKVDKRLKNLFQESYPNIKVFSEYDTIEQNTYQKYIAIGSLCKFYRNHTDDFMNSKFKSYTIKNINNHSLKNLKNLKIGFSWFSFAEKNAAKRSLSVDEVSRILSCNKNSFINLQYGEVKNQIESINNISENKLVTLDNIDLTGDIETVAGIINSCDLIITIDNTLAHLASSLGKQVWVLLPYSADFKWMEDITASLWYENTLVLRQSSNSSWENVIKTIEHAFSE